MSEPDLTIVLPITMNTKLTTESEKPQKYGFLLALAALALVTWLFSRFFGWGRATKPALSKKAEKLQREIETLEILQEQAKLNLRRVRLEQKTLQTEEDKANVEEPFHHHATDFQQEENGTHARSV